MGVSVLGVFRLVFSFQTSLMKGHLAVLNAFSRQRSKRGEVLRQTQRHSQASELGSRFYAHDSPSQDCGWMVLGGTSNDANCHRHHQNAGKHAVAINGPFGKGSVLPTLSGERVRTRLDASPVVTRGHHQ